MPKPNPDTIKLVRQYAAPYQDQIEVAAYAAIKPETLRAFVTGEQELSRDQIYRLSLRLGVPRK